MPMHHVRYIVMYSYKALLGQPHERLHYEPSIRVCLHHQHSAISPDESGLRQFLVLQLL